MISYRKADILHHFKENASSPTLLVEIDENYIVKTEGLRLMDEKGFTMPAVMRDASTCDYMTMNNIDGILFRLYHDHEIPVGDVDRKADPNGDVNEDQVSAASPMDKDYKSGTLRSVKENLDKAMREEGINFISSTIVDSVPAIEYKLPSIYKRADILNRFKTNKSQEVKIIAEIKPHPYNVGVYYPLMYFSSEDIPQWFRFAVFKVMLGYDDFKRIRLPERGDAFKGQPYEGEKDAIDAVKETIRGIEEIPGLKNNSLSWDANKHIFYLKMDVPMQPIKTADILQRFKQKSGWLGLPVRFLESKNTGTSNYVVKSQDERTIFVAPKDATNTATFRMKDATVRDGVVYIVTQEEHTNALGARVTVNGRDAGRIEDIKDGYIITESKKIDIKNWSLSIDQRNMVFSLKK